MKKFDKKINEVLQTIDEVVAPAGAAPTQPAPQMNNQQAPANAQGVPAQVDPNQQQQQQQQPEWTPEQILQAALQADPNQYEDVDPKSEDYFSQVATRLMTPPEQAQAQANGQPVTGADGNPVNPAAPSNPSTASATPAATTPIPR